MQINKSERERLKLREIKDIHVEDTKTTIREQKLLRKKKKDSRGRTKKNL